MQHVTHLKGSNNNNLILVMSVIVTFAEMRWAERKTSGYQTDNFAAKLKVSDGK